MKLVVPTDFEILQALSDGRRNNAVNIAAELDKNRSYINTRLPVLEDFGLVQSVGPSPNSGLYEITPRGHAALKYRQSYGDDEFEELVESEVTSSSS